MKVKRTGDELKVKIMAVIASAIIQSIMLVFLSHFANGGRLWDTEGNIVPSKPFVKISQNVLCYSTFYIPLIFSFSSKLKEGTE